MTNPTKPTTATSPAVTHLEWGRVEVEGYENSFRDVRLYPGGADEWDWNLSNTHHKPGIMPADVQFLLDKGAEVVILSKGQEEQLHTHPDSITLLEARGIPYERLETREAVARYNALRGEGKAVAALIHSTC